MIRCEPSQIDESRPFATADQAKLRAWAERYTAALSKKPRDASVDFDVIGREIYSWLDGGERWLERIRARGIQPPWLFEITAPKETSTRPDERALLEAPWELLRDAHGPLAARLDVLFNPVRRSGERGEPKAPSENELSMIFMAAAPRGASPLLFEEEEAAILDATRRLPLDLVAEESGALARMAERMAEEAPVDILQLSCHGNAKPRGSCTSL